MNTILPKDVPLNWCFDSGFNLKSIIFNTIDFHTHKIIPEKLGMWVGLS